MRRENQSLYLEEAVKKRPGLHIFLKFAIDAEHISSKGFHLSIGDSLIVTLKISKDLCNRIDHTLHISVHFITFMCHI